MTFLERATEIEEQIIGWRRAIHQNPELGFEELQTANLVAESLREMGLEVEVGVGRTGVVARVGDGNGPKIGIRADMDALPIQEAVDLPFKSQVPGKMHACGHDAHTAMLLGAARILHNTPDLSGEIRFLFQPSEERWDAEGISGATAMIADNAVAELDHVIALHVDSTLPVGQVRIGEGYVLAAADTFTATIIGEGTHGASPHMGKDPFFMLAQVINAIQGVRSRQTDPTSASVITIGAIHGGEAPNVIPDRVEIRGTIRSYDEAIRDQLHEGLEKALSISRVFGGDYELQISKGYPALYNDPAVAGLMRDIAQQYTDAQPAPPRMGAEDFSYMAQEAPGAMMFLGAKYDDQHRPHHSPIFALGEDSFKYGAAILAETAVALMKSRG